MREGLEGKDIPTNGTGESGPSSRGEAAPPTNDFTGSRNYPELNKRWRGGAVCGGGLVSLSFALSQGGGGGGAYPRLQCEKQHEILVQWSHTCYPSV